MKKLVCMLLTMLFILSTVAFADVSGEVSYSETERTVYIAGDLSNTEAASGNYVTLLIKNKEDDSVKYIAQKRVGDDKKYEIKFVFAEELADCDILIREGDNPVEDSVTAAYTQQSTMYSFIVRDENGSRFIEPGEMAKVVASIDNKHGKDGKYKILVAFYDANQKLLSCRTVAQGEFAFRDIKVEVGEISALAIPEGTDMIKAFFWEDTKDIIPLAKNQESEISDMKFGGDTEKVRVAFLGDSITYQTQYSKAVEHYYHTRYPDKDIVFVNKGIGGNMSLELKQRIGWDIIDDKVAGDIDEATIMLGMNDIVVAPMDGSKKDIYMTDETVQKEKLDVYLNDLEIIIKKCLDANISLTFITSSLYDDSIGFTGASSEGYENGVNLILGKGMEELKKLAAKYDIPVIDLWTPTTEVTATIREEYGETGPVVTGTDRVHPDEQGGFYMGYQFAKQQDGNPIVAKVGIDATERTVNTQNANVTLKTSSASGVEYEYLAGAIPVAYTDSYKKWEGWGVPVTEDINQEIIKVAGLESGEYTITIDGNTLSEKFDATELAEGVNIAIDANNPAQVQAKAAFELEKIKAANENAYRMIARTQQYFNKKGLNATDYGTDTTAETLMSILGVSEGTAKNLVKYFSSDPNNYSSKMYEVENWNKLRQQEDAARDAAKPIKRTVVIAKAN